MKDSYRLFLNVIGMKKEFWDEVFQNYMNHKGTQKKWEYLEELHIIGQNTIFFHYYSHFLMLKESIIDRNIGEFFGQILRIFLVFPGHVFGKLPQGNPGTTRVSAFASFPKKWM